MDQASAYKALAGALVTICPSNFSEARITASLKDDWSEVVYSCETSTEKKNGLGAPADTDFEVDDALHDLRSQMKQDGEEAWSRCTFTLFPDGNFKFDVAYDD